MSTSTKISPLKRRGTTRKSMHRIDVSRLEDEEEDQQSQSPSYRIYKKTSKFKEKAYEIRRLNYFRKQNEKDKDKDKDKKMPDCLQAVLSKMEREKIGRESRAMKDNPKKLNTKFQNSLFLDRIDFEDIKMITEGNESEHFDLETQSSTDPTTGAIVSRTKLIPRATKKENRIALKSIPIPSVVNKRIDPKLDHNKLLFPHVQGLDGNIKLISHEDAYRYFGPESRVSFFEHYRRMREATMHIAPTLMGDDSVDADLDASMSMSVLTADVTVIHHERDQDSAAIDGTLEDEEGESFAYTMNTGPNAQSIASFKAMFQTDAATASSTRNISSVMPKLNQDYYNAFESSVCKDTVCRSVDKDILAHNSFKVYHSRPYVKRNSPRTAGKTNRGLPTRLEPLLRSAAAVTNNSSRDTSRAGSRAGSTASSSTFGSRPPLLKRDSERSYSMYSYSSDKSAPKAADALNELIPASPRTKYISGCIRDSLYPMPNLILRKNFTTSHKLAHYGIGDKMGKVLAECLKDLPHVEALNLCDNNLTDDSLKFLIQSIISIKSLQELDLSRNKIDGESSEALAEYLSQAECPLVKLTLQSADVDDGECNHFVQCLVSNEKLLEIDLSSNLLGTAEVASTGDANIITGGVSIANFISSTSCKLQVLKLSWNSIRLNSAVHLAKSVAFNNTITHLDLSSNGMGWAAGEFLGDAIMENRTLKTLMVASNSFTSTACLSMCVGVVENLAMKHLSLNENPIGEVGAKMMMQTSITLGSRVNLTATSCNTITLDERCWYDPAMPCRDYVLDLTQPFHRAVAFHLLQVVASHSTLIIPEASYEAPGTKAVKLQLEQIIMKDREQFFDEEQVTVMKGLRLLSEAASNISLGKQLFYEADADNSGRLDKEELREVLGKIGFTIDEDRIQDIFAVFDIDGAGTIDLSEFLSLLKSQHKEATQRIREMTEYPVMAPSTSPGQKYVPPRVGTLYIKVIDGFVRKKNFYTISSVDQKYAYKMAKGIGDVLMMSEAVRNSKIRMNEAHSMYKMMYKEMGDKAEVLVKVLPQMMLPHEARQLVTKVTHDDRVQLSRLKAAFGVAVRPMFGAYNGHYCLDLSKPIHRTCFVRLLEQSQTVNAQRASQSIYANGKVGDTSQHGNWTSFRNEYWNGSPVEITPKLFTPLPHSGILEFDFSGGTRPTGGELRLTDKRVCKVLINICLLQTENTSDAMNKLSTMKKRAHAKSRDGKLFMPMYEMKIDKCLEAGRYSDIFYDNLYRRRAVNAKCSRKEEVKVNFMGMNGKEAEKFTNEMKTLHQKVKQQRQNNSRGSTAETNTASETGDVFPNGGDGNISASAAAEGEDQTADTDDDDDNEEEDDEENFDDLDLNMDAEGEEEGNDEEEASMPEDILAMEENSTNDNDNNDGGGAGDEESLASSSMQEGGSQQQSDMMLFLRQKKIKETKHRMQMLLQAKRGVSKHAKAVRFVEIIEESFQQLWILSRHLALIVQLFLAIFGDTAKTPFYGSYACEIVILLFSRVIDIHNFELVLEVLDAKDTACVFCRLGWLNLFNPLKPEVTVELDMRRPEERTVAKMIVYLSVDEPGINLTWKRFQWKREIDPVPGWDVTEPWMTEEGMPDHGKFAFTYYSGEGKNKQGCIPNIQLRKALTHLVLIDENEIIEEDAFLPDRLVCTAEQHYDENSEVWEEYLVPGLVTGSGSSATTGK